MPVFILLNRPAELARGARLALDARVEGHADVAQERPPRVSNFAPRIAETREAVPERLSEAACDCVEERRVSCGRRPVGTKACHQVKNVPAQHEVFACELVPADDGEFAACDSLLICLDDLLVLHEGVPRVAYRRDAEADERRRVAR